MLRLFTCTLQEEEYRLRQLLELGPHEATQQQPELQPLQGDEQDETFSDGSPNGANDLVGRGGSIGTGYFDAAGNWQTYDMDADMGSADVGTVDVGTADVGTAVGEAAGFAAAAQVSAARCVAEAVICFLHV